MAKAGFNTPGIVFGFERLPACQGLDPAFRTMRASAFAPPGSPELRTLGEMRTCEDKAFTLSRLPQARNSPCIRGTWAQTGRVLIDSIRNAPTKPMSQGRVLWGSNSAGRLSESVVLVQGFFRFRPFKNVCNRDILKHIALEREL